MSETPRQPAPSAPRSGSFLRSMKAVAWGFLGLRKRNGLQQDFERTSPLHLVAAALLGLLLLVGLLVGVVHWVV